MLKKMMVVAVAMIVSFASVSSAFDVDITGDASVNYLGKYVWRGQLLNDDPVVQPSVGFQVGKLYLNLWGNMDTTSINGNNGEFNEVDFTIDYSDQITEVLGFSVGAIRYDFPNTDYDATTEIYAGLNLDVFLSPTVTVYYDIDEIEGMYVNFGIGHSLAITETVALDMGASMGWGNKRYNEGYWPSADGGSSLQDLTLTMALPIALGDWTLTPSLTYVTLMDSDLRDADDYATESDYLYAGIGLSTTF